MSCYDCWCHPSGTEQLLHICFTVSVSNNPFAYGQLWIQTKELVIIFNAAVTVRGTRHQHMNDAELTKSSSCSVDDGTRNHHSQQWNIRWHVDWNEERLPLNASTLFTPSVRVITATHLHDVWLSGVVVECWTDLWSTGRGFESQPPRCRMQPWASC